MDAAKLEWGTEPASHHVVVEWRNVSTALLAIVESMGDGVDNAEEVTDEWDPIEGNGLLLKDDRGEVTPGDPKSLTLLKINEDGTFDVEANDGSAWADVPEGPPTQVRSEDVVGWVDAPIAVGDIIFGRGKDGTHGKLQVTKIGAKRLSVVPVDFEWSTHPKTVRSDYVERYVEGQHTENLIPPPPTELYCETCDRVVDEGDAEPGYECGDCGTEFTRENSADGDSNQCPDCNKFASRSETPYCPDCAEQLTEHLSCQGKESP
jgi:DNA-directed RNA polymerase subunit RPC12/RpoP